MNNIVQNAIAASRERTVNDALSGYNIYWIYIKPVGGGIVTEADKKKLHRDKSFMSFPNEKEIKFAIPKSKYNEEVARLKGLKGLSKPMKVSYITDTQFGRKMGPTQKQLEGSFVIGNSGVTDGTVANAIAAQKLVATNAKDVDWLDAVNEVNHAIEKAVEIVGQWAFDFGEKIKELEKLYVKEPNERGKGQRFINAIREFDKNRKMLEKLIVDLRRLHLK